MTSKEYKILREKKNKIRDKFLLSTDFSQSCKLKEKREKIDLKLFEYEKI